MTGSQHLVGVTALGERTRSRTPKVDRSGDPWNSVSAGSSYRLDVIGVRVNDLVKNAGGWLFDRMMAGWEVNVFLEEDTDTRPLRILGLRPIQAEPGRLKRVESRAVVASSENVQTSKSLTDLVNRALMMQSEVTLWGSVAPASITYEASRIEYRMSSAALAFKAQAMLAASIGDGRIPSIERFLDYAGWGRSDGSDSLRHGRAPWVKP